MSTLYSTSASRHAAQACIPGQRFQHSKPAKPDCCTTLVHSTICISSHSVHSSIACATITAAHSTAAENKSRDCSSTCMVAIPPRPVSRWSANAGAAYGVMPTALDRFPASLGRQLELRLAGRPPDGVRWHWTMSAYKSNRHSTVYQTALMSL